jgi:hypothetical protein|tara:strand:- start:809 stop:1294 length:486 start_codon:yes stop_codon:yes gene_type:complete
MTDSDKEEVKPKPKGRFHSLPATEALIFDIVKYLLEGNGSSSSREIVEYISFTLNKSRRHTAPEIVGVLRNRKMFCPTSGYKKHSGNRWRLDLNELERYISSKKYTERAEAADLPQMILRLKRRNISETISLLNSVLSAESKMEDDELIHSIHDGLLQLWG